MELLLAMGPLMGVESTVLLRTFQFMEVVWVRCTLRKLANLLKWLREHVYPLFAFGMAGVNALRME
jgi:hypothetical protein